MFFGVAGIAISAAMLGAGIYMGGQPAVARSAPDSGAPGRAAVEQIVRDYLLANPEVMVEVQAALEDRQKEQQRLAQLAAIGSQDELLFRSEDDGVRGVAEGGTTMVEFFDYNCGFCKRAYPDLIAMLEADPKLRVVYKEFPILGPDSQKAHIVSMAFRRLMPEKWPQFHDALMTSPGRADEPAAIRVALALGADEAALREEMRSPRIVAAINATYQLADQLSITGTPSYVVGNEVVFGALGREVLSEKVAVARACAETRTC